MIKQVVNGFELAAKGQVTWLIICSVFAYQKPERLQLDSAKGN